MPTTVALDTSFLVRALIETEPLHSSCRSLLERLIESGVNVVTSELLPIELAEASFGIALKERWGRQWRRHRSDGRSRRKARRLLADVSSRYESLLSSVTHISIPLALVADAASGIMVDYGLASYDAVHAAGAIAAGAEAIVTTDTGFALLPAGLLLIYTDRSRLPACRAKRAR
ncbi:MAG: type II toxin-antitoxin system VapC family toxin [Solirubrobacterales bacterium]